MKFDNPYGQKICLICCDHCSGHRESESVFQAPVIVKVLFPAPVIVKVKVFFSSSGQFESKCVSIDVYQNWSNLIMTFDIDQFLPLWKGVDTG